MYKDKKFLIPQEIADGAVNVGLFLGITSSIHKVTNKYMENGKIMFSETKAPLQRILSKSGLSLQEALKNNDNKISKILTNQSDIDKFVKLKGGVGLAATLVGSAISCNILTPLIRNVIGARWQSRLTKEKTAIKNTADLTPTQPLAVKINATPLKQNPTRNIYNNFYTSSDLKI